MQKLIGAFPISHDDEHDDTGQRFVLHPSLPLPYIIIYTE